MYDVLVWTAMIHAASRERGAWLKPSNMPWPGLFPIPPLCLISRGQSGEQPGVVGRRQR